MFIRKTLLLLALLPTFLFSDGCPQGCTSHYGELMRTTGFLIKDSMKRLGFISQTYSTLSQYGWDLWYGQVEHIEKGVEWEVHYYSEECDDEPWWRFDRREGYIEEENAQYYYKTNFYLEDYTEVKELLSLIKLDLEGKILNNIYEYDTKIQNLRKMLECTESPYRKKALTREINEELGYRSNSQNYGLRRKNIWYQLSDEVDQLFEKKFDRCIEKGHWNGAYYQKGLLLFDQGDYFGAFQEMERFLDAEGENIKDLIDASYKQGVLKILLGQYDEAIKILGQTIHLDPKNKEARLERAIAYFEKGDFDKSIEDFTKSGLELEKIDLSKIELLDFSAGLIDGIAHGFEGTLTNFIPSMLGSLQGLSNGIWAFAQDPPGVSKAVAEATRNIICFIRNNPSMESLKLAIPELGTLIDQWPDVSDKERGRLTGTIIGKYGTEIFLLAGVGKCSELFMSLRRANAMLTLDTMKTLQKRHALEEISKGWNSKVSMELEKLRGGGLQGAELYKKYRDAKLSETQVRKILHQAGHKTFKRPKGIPKDWEVSI